MEEKSFWNPKPGRFCHDDDDQVEEFRDHVFEVKILTPFSLITFNRTSITTRPSPGRRCLRNKMAAGWESVGYCGIVHDSVQYTCEFGLVICGHVSSICPSRFYTPNKRPCTTHNEWSKWQYARLCRTFEIRALFLCIRCIRRAFHYAFPVTLLYDSLARNVTRTEFALHSTW